MPSANEIQAGLTGAWRMMLGRSDGIGLLDLSADGFWNSFFAMIVALPPLLSSFRPESLQGAKETAPQLARALLLDTLWSGWFDIAVALGCSACVTNYNLMDAALMAQLHAAGMRALVYTVNDAAEAQRLLRLYAVPDGAEGKLWKHLDTTYFQRHSAEEIAWHARHLYWRVDKTDPVVKARLARDGVGMQVMVYLPDQKELFARMCGFFGRAGLSILEAKICTTRNGYALDTFTLNNPQQPEASYRETLQLVEFELTRLLAEQPPLAPPAEGPANAAADPVEDPTQKEDAVIVKLPEPFVLGGVAYRNTVCLHQPDAGSQLAQAVYALVPVDPPSHPDDAGPTQLSRLHHLHLIGAAQLRAPLAEPYQGRLQALIDAWRAADGKRSPFGPLLAAEPAWPGGPLALLLPAQSAQVCLRTVLLRPILPWPARSALARQLALALAEATALRPGLVHGELTPSQVMVLAEPGQELRLWLRLPTRLAGLLGESERTPMAEGTDSAARQAAPELSEEDSRYSAPECLGGAPPTQSSDVYSLAAIVFELLGGDLLQAAQAVRLGARLPPLPPGAPSSAELQEGLNAALSLDPRRRAERPRARAVETAVRRRARSRAHLTIGAQRDVHGDTTSPSRRRGAEARRAPAAGHT